MGLLGRDAGIPSVVETLRHGGRGDGRVREDWRRVTGVVWMVGLRC